MAARGPAGQLRSCDRLSRPSPDRRPHPDRLRVAPRRHLRYRLHRPAGLRDHHPAVALLCRVVRRQRLHRGPARHELLADAVRVLLLRAGSDRIGRRPIILLGLAGSCASYLVLAVAGSLSLVFAARILGGIAGANIATACAYIADVTTPENRARDGTGRRGLRPGLHLRPRHRRHPRHLGPSAPMWVASALCGVNLLAAAVLLPESRTGADRRPAIGRMEALWRAFADRRLILLMALYFIVTAAFSGFEATFALFTERRFGFTVSTIGYVFAFIGCVLALVQGVLVGRAVKRVGEGRLIPIAIAIIALGLGLVPFAWTLPALLAATGVLAVGMGFNGPALSSMVSRLTHADDQGGMLGLASSLASLGRVVGPAWGGYMFDALGPTSPYVSASAIMLLAVAVAVASLRSGPAVEAS
ncbi:MAG: MFS transporter [Vicinamibacterales bacterium]